MAVLCDTPFKNLEIRQKDTCDHSLHFFLADDAVNAPAPDEETISLLRVMKTPRRRSTILSCNMLCNISFSM